MGFDGGDSAWPWCQVVRAASRAGLGASCR